MACESGFHSPASIVVWDVTNTPLDPDLRQLYATGSLCDLAYQRSIEVAALECLECGIDVGWVDHRGEPDPHVERSEHLGERNITEMLQHVEHMRHLPCRSIDDSTVTIGEHPDNVAWQPSTGDVRKTINGVLCY